ncbi:MAG: type II toxin-antitoxin system PemK/MazF family toxin [Armatimonadetes bacterium]|nr:type II toxin-antitoxin system PemK/MazF family toxin [Armatimonadota bacterium]
MPEPLRGDIWLADPQGGRRPVLIVSDDRLNSGHADVVFAVPLTTRGRGIPSHVTVPASEGGLKATSYAMVEHTRSISRTRLVGRWGAVGGRTMTEVEDRLRALLGL